MRLFILSLMTILLIGCSVEKTPKPPQPDVTINSEAVPLTRSASLWNNLAGDNNAKAKRITIEPDSLLKINYQKQPSELILYIQKDQSKENKYFLKENTFQLPDEEGLYHCRLFSKWKEGYTIYSFDVSVKKS